jgi:hypothetical protein
MTSTQQDFDAKRAHRILHIQTTSPEQACPVFSIICVNLLQQGTLRFPLAVFKENKIETGVERRLHLDYFKNEVYGRFLVLYRSIRRKQHTRRSAKRDRPRILFQW